MLCKTDRQWNHWMERNATHLLSSTTTEKLVSIPQTNVIIDTITTATMTILGYLAEMLVIWCRPTKMGRWTNVRIVRDHHKSRIGAMPSIGAAVVHVLVLVLSEPLLAVALRALWFMVMTVLLAVNRNELRYLQFMFDWNIKNEASPVNQFWEPIKRFHAEAYQPVPYCGDRRTRTVKRCVAESHLISPASKWQQPDDHAIIALR